MNAGNKTRQQADGYQIDAFSKPNSIKDINNEPMFSLICRTIYEEDNTFIDFKKKFGDLNEVMKTPIDEIKTDCDKAKMEVTKSKREFEQILKYDELLAEIAYGK